LKLKKFRPTIPLHITEDSCSTLAMLSSSGNLENWQNPFLKNSGKTKTFDVPLTASTFRMDCTNLDSLHKTKVFTSTNLQSRKASGVTKESWPSPMQELTAVDLFASLSLTSIFRNTTNWNKWKQEWLPIVFLTKIFTSSLYAIT
jgi:hypothetical protein